MNNLPVCCYEYRFDTNEAYFVVDDEDESLHKREKEGKHE